MPKTSFKREAYNPRDPNMGSHLKFKTIILNCQGITLSIKIF